MNEILVVTLPGANNTALAAHLQSHTGYEVRIVGEAKQATSDTSRSQDVHGALSILVLIEPGLAARRMAADEGCALPVALARFERSLRQALSSLDGLPVLLVDDGTDVGEVTSAVQAILKGEPVHVAVTNDQRSEPLPPGTPVGLVDLWAVSTLLIGAHRSLQLPPLGAESEWTTSLLATLAERDQLKDALLFAASQLAKVIDVPPQAARRERRGHEDREDQFHEAAEGEHYRLNASEDREAYHQWLARHRRPTSLGGQGEKAELAPATRHAGRRPPTFSVVVPVYKTPIWALERCVSSVLQQSFADWELILSDDASGDEDLTETLRRIARVDRRISVLTSPTNGGISNATNRAVAASRGAFVAFLDHDDELAPHALQEVADVIATHDEVDLIYSDEDKIDASGERFDPFFKPEWSPDLLLSYAYLSHLTVVRRSIFDQVGGLRREFDGSQDYDLSLRVSECARTIVHIADILYHWRSMPGSAASDTTTTQAKPWAYEAGRRAIEDALTRRGEPADVTMNARFPGRYDVRRHVKGRPLVSIIIPFRDEPALLATCVRTLRVAPGYDNFEFILVDNDSALPETAALLEELARDEDVKVLRAPGPFNWAAINNAAAKASTADLLLFLNNDIEAKVDGWLDAMVGHAQRVEVGAVGARLVYPDDTIQHAGVVIGLGGIAGHVLRGLPTDQPGYASLAISTRDCSIVTGAAMMVRRELFVSTGGFDETLAVAFNDVDFCLRLRAKDLLVVYSALSELVHHESKSRGHTDDFAENKLMLSRWRDAMLRGDPYHSKHLSHWRYWCPISTAQEDDRWRNYLETRILTLDSSSSE